ncbi:MAG TPA: peptide chain release factor N(5)-glutamine methyltransferase, partial [Candidatus Eisenbacteria bacterium]|nr:peptide chain release factor N(5)-glutamine methyltransferase [Candidatus Eisenbacteria bacterium]
VARVLRDAAARLAGSPAPQADAEELASRLLGVTRAELLRSGARALAPGERAALERWVARRAAGEPVQYITGRAAFRSLDLAVSPAVLVPRPETEGLVERVLEAFADEPARFAAPRVLDLGTGSGAIALAIASEVPGARVVATDASAAALAVARANAEALGLSRVELRLGSWFEAVGADERFEAIVSNPPYIATGEWDALPDDVRRHEPHAALFAGDTGLEALREIVDEAPDHLVAGGLLALELAEARAREVAAWLEGARDWERATLHDDLAGLPRVVIARRAAGPAIAPRQWAEER